MSANVAYTVCVSRCLARRLYCLYFAVTVPGRFKHFRFQNLSAYRTFLMPAPLMHTVRCNIYNPATFCMAYRFDDGQLFAVSARPANVISIACLFTCRLFCLNFAVAVSSRLKHFRFQNLIAYRAFLMPASVMRAVCCNIYNPAAFCMAKCIRFHLFTAQFFPAIRTVDYRFV